MLYWYSLGWRLTLPAPPLTVSFTLPYTGAVAATAIWRDVESECIAVSDLGSFLSMKYEDKQSLIGFNKICTVSWHISVLMVWKHSLTGAQYNVWWQHGYASKYGHSIHQCIPRETWACSRHGTSIWRRAMIACVDRLALLRQHCHNPALHCAMMQFVLGLPLGLEAPVMTPNGVIFLFFSSGFKNLQFVQKNL